MPHHHDMVGDVFDHIEVVRHEQHAQTPGVAKFSEQVKDGALHRHIEGGGGLVGQEDPGVAGEGEGDHDPLLLAATQFVGVLLCRPQRQVHFFKQLGHFFLRRLACDALVELEGFSHLGPHLHGRVEGRHGVLKNHRHLLSYGRFLSPGPCPQGPVRTMDFAAHNLAAWREEAHDGQ